MTMNECDTRWHAVSERRHARGDKVEDGKSRPPWADRGAERPLVLLRRPIVALAPMGPQPPQQNGGFPPLSLPRGGEVRASGPRPELASVLAEGGRPARVQSGPPCPLLLASCSVRQRPSRPRWSRPFRRGVRAADSRPGVVPCSPPCSQGLPVLLCLPVRFSSCSGPRPSIN